MTLNPMFIGPNQYEIDKYVAGILPQSVFFYDPFNGASFGTTPVDQAPISSFKERYGRTTWDLSQPTSTSQPLYQSNGGKPYLKFDGVDDVLFTAAIDSTTYFSGNNITLFMLVLAGTSSGGNPMRYCGGNAATRIIGVENVSVNKIAFRSSSLAVNATSSYATMKVFAASKTSAGAIKTFTNGVIEGVSSGGNPAMTTDSLFFGSYRNFSPYNAFLGGIGELIVFNTALTDYQIYMISHYFMQRRGI